MLKIIKLAEIALEVPELTQPIINLIENEIKYIKHGGGMKEAINIARDEGKLKAVKYLKEYTGKTLMECKHAIEDKMAELGLNFKSFQ